MQFDVIIGNPPYSNGLYIQFLNKGIDLLKEGGVMCAIHPSAYIINKKDIKRKDHIKFNNYIEKYGSSVKLIDGNKVFDNAGFLSPLVITTLKKELNTDIHVEYAHLGENKKDVVQSVSDIWMHGDSIVKSIFNKVKDKIDLSFEDMLYRTCNLSFKLYLKLNQIAGNKPKPGIVGNNPDFNCLIYKADVDANALDNLLTTKPTKSGNYLGVNNKKEAKHAYEYSLLKFTRFCLSLYKINSNLHRGELKMVPYLDFSKTWTDGECYTLFGLNDNEINFIETYIQDYYECDFK